MRLNVGIFLKKLKTAGAPEVHRLALNEYRASTVDGVLRHTLTSSVRDGVHERVHTFKAGFDNVTVYSVFTFGYMLNKTTRHINECSALAYAYVLDGKHEYIVNIGSAPRVVGEVIKRFDDCAELFETLATCVVSLRVSGLESMYLKFSNAVNQYTGFPVKPLFKSKTVTVYRDLRNGDPAGSMARFIDMNYTVFTTKDATALDLVLALAEARAKFHKVKATFDELSSACTLTGTAVEYADSELLLLNGYYDHALIVNYGGLPLLLDLRGVTGVSEHLEAEFNEQHFNIAWQTAQARLAVLNTLTD